ncbi:nucleotidyltransferase family protein [Janthinobacterium sp. 1_2014MBL_MicDiv]|uniref:nucleotidyltransferase family protein n=1 Tax=Janthinobacterium sp. 1_2014MBL_MicDiv TaxID=1644131 RepID=UPI0008F51427|nr:nucleotidyltransferase family protein [Janthinobacterium sp. 1_2014MBL_MicDiv]APA70303.1 molybdopterin-guanine dinucleotide biosynthesis protein MobA [Janthinobacterium sp. 1_2014MBL_MicDiv]
MSTVGILLAAGRGRRFDPSGVQNKLLQPLPDGPYAGLPVVAAAASAMLAALPRVLAVVRADDTQVARVLGALGCEVRVCHDADMGMAASLTCAIEHVRGAPGWLIALGDMPWVEAATIAALSHAIADGARIAVPVFQGRRGNPVAFSAVHLPLLLALDGDQGARSIVRGHAVREVAVDDSGILRDIDTPDDL